ncbi:hypothetical protein [Streptomyces sp. NPDC000229]|uniref:hypothetical protein n=1 Tax=Streptomyces sp. NPDC000229 TaxID=3154247 RepID=UPI0033193026
MSLYEPKNTSHRGQYQWSRTGDAAARAISDLQPYLRVKKEQARIALEVQKLVVAARNNTLPTQSPAGSDLGSVLARLRDEVVTVLDQDRRASSRRESLDEQTRSSALEIGTDLEPS